MPLLFLIFCGHFQFLKVGLGHFHFGHLCKKLLKIVSLWPNPKNKSGQSPLFLAKVATKKPSNFKGFQAFWPNGHFFLLISAKKKKKK